MDSAPGAVGSSSCCCAAISFSATDATAKTWMMSYVFRRPCEKSETRNPKSERIPKPKHSNHQNSRRPFKDSDFLILVSFGFRDSVFQRGTSIGNALANRLNAVSPVLPFLKDILLSCS